MFNSHISIIYLYELVHYKKTMSKFKKSLIFSVFSHEINYMSHKYKMYRLFKKTYKNAVIIYIIFVLHF